jgi:hypothetical protein
MPEYLTPGVYVRELPIGPRSIEPADTSTAAILGRARRGRCAAPTLVTSLAEHEAGFGGRGTESPLFCAVRAFFANGGRRAIVVRVALSRFDDGLRALEKAEPFGVLVLAPPRHGRDWTGARWNAAARLCEARRAFLIVDPPFRWSRAGEVAPADLGVESRNAALYFPHLVEATQSGAQRAVAPGGAVAGVYARTDLARGVWKAPAGTHATIAGAIGPRVALGETEARRLGELHVNPLRALPGAGLAVWGARTLSRDEEWKYVPVRRLLLFVEESLYRGTEWAVFEPNGEPTWSRLRAQVAEFLLGLWKQGALHGSKPEQAFFVKCDATTGGDLLVGVASLKPAEFVLFRIQRRAPGAGRGP